MGERRAAAAGGPAAAGEGDSRAFVGGAGKSKGTEGGESKERSMNLGGPESIIVSVRARGD
jgi:hypothetical protein